MNSRPPVPARLRTSRLRPLLLAVAVALAALEESPAQSIPAAETQQEYARRGYAKIRGMTAARQLSESQAARISYLLQDHTSMVELFSKHGLLSVTELDAKIRGIDEITRTGILETLTRDQRAIWWTWDLRLDEASLKRPTPRQRLLP